MISLLLIAGCTPTPTPSIGEPSPSDALLRSTPPVLTVTDLTPGKDAAARLVGTAGDKVRILQGDPTGTSCPPQLHGACVGLSGIKVLATVTLGANGSALHTFNVSASLSVGTTLGFQALVEDKNGTVFLSHVVDRTLIARGAPKPAGSNVLIVLIDDVGVDRIGLYGAPAAATTPVLDGLAATGMVFDNAWAMALCSPTRAALQTGLLGRRTGYGGNASVLGGTSELDPRFTTIAELVDHSPWFTYDTSYVGKWHLASLGSPSGTLGPKVQGWNWWTGMLSSVVHWIGPNPGRIEPSYFHFQRIDDNGDFLPTDGYATTTSVDDAISRIGVMAEPWMLQVSFNAAHEPYHVPPGPLHTVAGLTKFSPESDLHRAATEAMDTELGRLLAAIPADVRENTMIFALGDNGTPGPAAEPWEDESHTKASLYDGGVHVPFIVNGPLVGQAGSRTAALAHVVDMFPTIAEIAGVEIAALPSVADPSEPLVVDGVSLLPTIADPTVTVRSTLYSEKFSPLGGGPFSVDARAMRDDRFKLISNSLCGIESFFEYQPGATDEGDNLLEGGPLSVEQEEALSRLRDAIAAQVLAMPYVADVWDSVPVVPDCGPEEDDTGEPAVP